MNRPEHPACGRMARPEKDMALASVRIPVTAANRRLLRALRAAELAAWGAWEANNQRKSLEGSGF
ncbi:MAG: hypothetical protein AB9869_07510 [Verrucomicrobiia bacterium]